ncbi:MAG: DotA/TraY family protein [Rhodospirillales bacterium]|nr:DotA/TraY family protein [Rhodospirillales bacterium]MCB9996142.1 DotA/TraY family protein [Rhodospirillales bacterium]
MQLTTKNILQYTLTPQLMPRLQGLFYSGFSYIAFFMAQIYSAVRLLPANHPYLIPENMGRFGIRHVISEAGNNLVYKKENIDQIFLYFIMLIGIVLLIVQMLMLLCAGFMEAAHAGPLYPSSNPFDFFSYFNTPNVEHDLAFVLLDRVFGIPGVNGALNTSFFTNDAGQYTCVVLNTDCFQIGQSTRDVTADRTIFTDYARTVPVPNYNFPWPFHRALRGMLQVYSVGLLVIAVFTFLYFMFAIAAETAQTGTAFGRRFNHLWAPIRMVVALGLLIPIAHGLNSSQWILMYAAKWGSGFATNGWIIYSNTMKASGTLGGPANTMVATPEAPPVNTLMEFGGVLATCKIAYERMFKRQGRPDIQIDAYIMNNNQIGIGGRRLLLTNYQQAAEFAHRGEVIIRFGERRVDPALLAGGPPAPGTVVGGGSHQTYDGGVIPYCGEITLNLTYVPENVFAAAVTEPGAWYMYRTYYQMVEILWQDAANLGAGISAVVGGVASIDFHDIGEAMANRHIAIGNNAAHPLPTAQELAGLQQAYQDYLETRITLAVMEQQASPEWLETLEQLGWGGAAIWYNKIAQLNGSLVSSVYAMPMVKTYPQIMEDHIRNRASADSAVSGETRFRDKRGPDAPVEKADDEESQILRAMYEAHGIWHDKYSDTSRKSNIYRDTINAIFGTEGLFNIVENEAQNIHPLAQLASIGRSIVDSAVRNLGYSAASGLGGGILNLFQQHAFGRVAASTSGFFLQVAMIGLSIGFVLFYVIPFLPFIYFFFAVGGWVKAIFEAMVGVPLWALAHIRIDGNGFPPDAAMGGYYLILEIFLRPLLIIFGFVASITIFAAQMSILHEIWGVVVSSVSGFEKDVATPAGSGTGSIEFLRNEVDEFFFTVIYAIIAYMMAMASFKLIDQIPNHLLRWMGANVSTFGEQAGDPAQNLVRNSLIGSNMMTGRLSQVGGAISGAGSSGGKAMMELTGRAGQK